MLLDLRFLIEKYKLSINGVIHIGAHHAGEHETYLYNGIKNIIYFEPVKKNYDILKNRIGDEFESHNVALGNFEGEVDMFIENVNLGMSCSILEPDLHLIQYPEIIFTEKETVKIKKLDSYNIDKNLFNMINIDVQGYELEVFKGSEKILPNIDYIMTEINRDEVYKNCAKVGELNDFLSKYGFELVEQTWVGGTWGDGFYIKK
jgi:FkbM family methyltransferase